jgi:porphobilinogen synthase
MAELISRPRRLRRTAALREMIRETRLDPSNLIYPLFVCHGEGVRREVKSMPGVFNLSVDELVKECEDARRVGVSSIIVFGLPEHKDERGSGAFAEDGVTQRAIRAVKREVKDMLVIADTCLCEYTSHGHCGVIEEGDVANDPTLKILAQTAISQAESGADIIAPSGMMDGMVAAIRAGLDAAGFPHLPILSYAVKYASAFYGPFREAADSAPQFGDRRGYQMDPPNVREALRGPRSMSNRAPIC